MLHSFIHDRTRARAFPQPATSSTSRCAHACTQANFDREGVEDRVRNPFFLRRGGCSAALQSRRTAVGVGDAQLISASRFQHHA